LTSGTKSLRRWRRSDGEPESRGERRKSEETNMFEADFAIMSLIPILKRPPVSVNAN